MDPFEPGERGEGIPELRLERTPAGALGGFSELQGPAGDGVLTASNEARLLVLKNDRACTVPDALRDRPARFAFESGFPLERIFASIVRPALQIAMLGVQAVAVHASSVELDGGGLAIAGWSESGKTETALAYMEDGAAFLSDKWTVLGQDGTLSAFPVGVGVRGWSLRYLPRLRSALSGAARGRLALARLAPRAAQALQRLPLKRGGYRGGAVDLAHRSLGLAERVPLAPSELRAAYGQRDDPARRVPVRALALLTTVPGSRVSAEPADPAWAASRLARSAAFERRAYFALRERARFALGGSGDGGLEEVVEREQALLVEALGRTTVISVRAPFPADPHEVASAVSRRL